ncbi:hypothetical protein BDY21DRAFT_373764 [Lineolata rhizophorae]|uniref:Cytochrome c oxidase-assembly factor COX23, mitochondrial n=1 Tax=Lineolata rhizophorae TaxID=578093 RepID=A0A6A6NTJ8_9PEZI|nr:hypothetical protein BDY21DRAFT_373764 [Lineolata rhizophorae]
MAEKEGDNPWSKDVSNRFNSKRYSEYFDPCQEAADRSIRCLHRNPGDKDMCQDYFHEIANRHVYRQMEARKEEKRQQGFKLW